MKPAILAVTFALVGGVTFTRPALSDAPQLTLQRIFASPDLSGPRLRAPKLSPDGRHASVLRARTDDRDRFDLWLTDVASGASRLLVDSKKLGTDDVLSEAEKMRRERARIAGSKGLTEYEWNAASDHLLVPLDGDLYLVALDGSTQRITATPDTETDARWSPDGRYVSFVRNQNLWLYDIAARRERSLTQDGTATLSWGLAEFVAQEEMDRAEGYWWSPDGSRLAVTRVDESEVEVVPRAAIGAQGTRVYEQRYPKAGTPNARVDLYIFRAGGGNPVKADLGPDSDAYLTRVDWLADDRALIVQRESRDHHRLDVLQLDASNGAAHSVLTETSPTWVNHHHNFRALKDGSFIWASERDGFQHLYHWQKGALQQLTRGPWMVRKVIGVDERGARVYFTANLDTPLEQHVYALDLKQPGPPQRLTEPGGWHEAVMDEHATRILVSRETPAQPQQFYLADTRGKRLAWIEENRLEGSHPYAPYLGGRIEPHYGSIPGPDGTDLYYELYSPLTCKADQRLPVFLEVYGGPNTQRVTRKWPSLIHQYLAQRGWIVFRLDNRGGANRGRAFADPIYRHMGRVEVDDQLRGLKWLATQPCVDPSRVAVFGWSYGGYMTLRLLEDAPGTFAAGVAGAPVTSWNLYDTYYTERFLGNPTQDREPYEISSALPLAGRIVDPLLLLHGMADDNVVFENSTMLMAKLQQAAQPFSMMVYPGQSHAITGEDTQVHLWTTILDFLDREVVARPSADATRNWSQTLRADIERFHEIALADHPGPVNPEDPAFRNKLEQYYQRALAHVPTAKTHADWEWTLRELSASFRDGHFGIVINKALTPVRAWPGFIVVSSGGKFIVSGRLDAQAPPEGAELVSCDGQSVSALADRRLGRVVNKWIMSGHREQAYPYLLIDRGDPYVTRMQRCQFRVGKRLSTSTLHWRPISDDDYEKIVAPYFKRYTAPVELRTFGPGKYWISLGSFETDPNSPSGLKLQAVVDAVRAHADELRKANAIVFDMRGNNGGSSHWSKLIATAIWGEQWIEAHEPRIGGVDYRASDGNIAYYQELVDQYSAQKPPNAEMVDWMKHVRDSMKTAKAAGQTFWRLPGSDPAPANLSPNPVTSKLFMITDGMCASACLDAADLLKNLGVVHIGRETSGDTLYIDVHLLPLPSGLGRVYVPVKVYRGRQRGDNETYTPDVPYNGDLADTQELERLVNQALASH